MTHQEALEKAVQKAINGGWKPGSMDRRPVVSWGAQYSEDYDGEGEGVMVTGYHAKSNASMWFFPLNTLTFNHAFAKALWGEELINGTMNTTSGRGIGFTQPAWQYHLQMMVVDPDPIAYLKKNI